MKRILLFGIMLISIVLTIKSQTYYYQLTKIASNNVTNTNVTGGQFITFMADICYESTHKGQSVGHGKLNRRSVSSQFKEYKGDSYWGTATFKFKNDLSKLNVITENGEIWVYTRTSAPSSVKTCSLIRKGGNNNNSSSSKTYNYHSHTVNNNTIIYNDNNYQNGNSSSGNYQQTNKRRSQGEWITKLCTACNGTGKSPIRSSAGYYGGTKKNIYCNICNGYFTPHYHKTCGVCKGKGTVKEYKY